MVAKSARFSWGIKNFWIRALLWKMPKALLEVHKTMVGKLSEMHYGWKNLGVPLLAFLAFKNGTPCQTQRGLEPMVGVASWGVRWCPTFDLKNGTKTGTKFVFSINLGRNCCKLENGEEISQLPLYHFGCGWQGKSV